MVGFGSLMLAATGASSVSPPADDRFGCGLVALSSSSRWSPLITRGSIREVDLTISQRARPDSSALTPGPAPMILDQTPVYLWPSRK